MDPVYKSFKDYFRYERLQDISYQVFESILAILVGAFIGALLSLESPALWLKVGTGITLPFYVVFTINRLLKSSHFPSAAIDHLSTRKKLEEMVSELERKKTLDSYIDHAIQALNVNTCDWTGGEKINEKESAPFCDTSLEDGLKMVLDAVIHQTHYIFDCDKSRFTVALNINFFPYREEIHGLNEKKFRLLYKHKTLVFRDDFDVKAALPDFILHDYLADGLKLKVHSQVVETFMHEGLRESVVIDEKKNLKLVTSLLPQVCEGGKNGAFIFFCDADVVIPQDIENVLLIFGRIVANWISKYEDCIRQRKDTVDDIASSFINQVSSH